MANEIIKPKDWERMYKKLLAQHNKLLREQKKSLKEQERKKTLKSLRSKVNYQKQKIRKQTEFAINAANQLDNISPKFYDFETTIIFSRSKGTTKEQIKINRERLSLLKAGTKEQYKKNINITLSKLAEKLKRTADSLERKESTREDIQEIIDLYKYEYDKLIDMASKIKAKYYKELFNKSALIYEKHIIQLEKLRDALPE